MKKIGIKFKKAMSLILCITILGSFSISLTGCNSKKVHILTRAEWVNELAEIFQLTECYNKEPIYSDVKDNNEYFDKIQACAEWGIIERTDEFFPNKRADVNFAISSAIKAIGIDKIEKSVNGRELNTEEDMLDYFNENCSVKYIKGSNLYEDTSEQIIREITTLYANLELKQFQDISYSENVIYVDDNSIIFSADGETGKIVKGDYKVGDIISIEPSQTYPEGKYAKITNLSGDTITYEEPSFEEMYNHVTMYGTYEPEVLGVVPLMDGVDVVSIGGEDVISQSYSNDQKIYVRNMEYSNSDVSNKTPVAKTISFKDIDLKVYATGESGGSSVTVAGDVKLKNIEATVDLDIWGVVVNKAELKVTDTIESNVSITGQIKKTFNLAKIPCKLYGTVGVDFILAVKVNVEGEASLVCSVDTVQSVEYQPFRTAKFNASASNPNLNVELKAKGSIKPEFKAQFTVGPIAVANIGAYSGVEASANTKIAGTSHNVGCVDISAYVPLSIFVGSETKKGDDTLLGRLGVKNSWTIWSSSTSPCKKKWHIEEGKVVPECTKSNKSDAEDTGSGDEPDNIDTDFINEIFEIDEALSISSYFSVIEEGNHDKLKVNHIPDGYSQDKLIFTSSDKSVATVDNNGNIYAQGAGVCVIKVSTSDGKYSQYCSVRVLASYDVDFSPLNYTKAGYSHYVYTA